MMVHRISEVSLALICQYYYADTDKIYHKLVFIFLTVSELFAPYKKDLAHFFASSLQNYLKYFQK